MTETIIILFIFFILLVFAIVFFARIQGAQTEKAVSKDVSGRALQVLQKVLFLPEIQCSTSLSETSSCYDEYSVQALARVASRGENALYYSDLFGNSNISIKKLYPVEEEPIMIYSNPLGEDSNINPFRMPILLCDYNSDFAREDCSF